MRFNPISPPLELKLFFKTAQMAKLHPLWGHKAKSRTWGPVGHLILFNSSQKREDFLNDYTNTYLLSEKYALIRNLFGTLTYQTFDHAENWISLYDPLVSRQPYKTQLQLLKKYLNE